MCFLVGLLGSHNPIPITVLVIISGLIPVVISSPSKISNIELKTRRTNCECGGKLTYKNRSTEITMYTRAGTSKGYHLEYRFVLNPIPYIASELTTIRWNNGPNYSM